VNSEFIMRLISFCTAATSRSGSQRTTVAMVHLRVR
jgi:hypothetical protein